MRAFNYLFIIIFTCIFFSGSLTGQSQSEQMLWFQVSEKVQVAPRTSGLFLVQKRYFLEQPDTYQDLFWASGAYRLKNIQVGGGFMYFSAHKRLNSIYRSIPELRPFQCLSYARKVTNTRWSYQIRAMVEERFLSEVSGDEIIREQNFQLRYRLRSNMIFHFAPNTSLKLSNEWLWRHTMALTQNRAFAEVTQSIKSIRLSAGYMNWFVRGIQKPWRHVWLFRMDHRISF